MSYSGQKAACVPAPTAWSCLWGGSGHRFQTWRTFLQNTVSTSHFQLTKYVDSPSKESFLVFFVNRNFYYYVDGTWHHLSTISFQLFSLLDRLTPTLVKQRQNRNVPSWNQTKPKENVFTKWQLEFTPCVVFRDSQETKKVILSYLRTFGPDVKCSYYWESISESD